MYPTCKMTRRQFVQLTGLLTLGGTAGRWRAWAGPAARSREYHVSLSADAVLQDPDFPALLAHAGVSCAWLASYFYGHWPWKMETLLKAREALQRAGLDAQAINVPLGHPGDSLGAKNGEFPLTPPPHWRLAVNRDGKTYAGTSLHAPATEGNAEALRQLRRQGFARFFVDDDFRLARGPGEIGGCFCDEHRGRFLRRTGLSPSRWPELLADARARRLSPLLRQWVEFTCDDLTGSFRAQQAAADGGLGIMVMYFGAEKAGIRLADYRHVPFRVGELMFDDRSFDPLKGKTDELFSALFHRRFAAPENACSETTAFPSDKLSAENMAAKLVVSTVADVRHTMFMSGVTPFPKTHWATLAPAMRRQAEFHSRLAGHRPRGPFKHYWGEASRYTGDDRPFSLFLATGIPFEVTDRPTGEGWTFLSDADAAAAAEGRLKSAGTRFLCRPNARSASSALEACPEDIQALFALKHRLLPELGKVPYVENDQPALLAWYPSARAALLWNLRPERTPFRIRCGKQTRELTLEPLGSELLTDVGV